MQCRFPKSTVKYFEYSLSIAIIYIIIIYYFNLFHSIQKNNFLIKKNDTTLSGEVLYRL